MTRAAVVLMVGLSLLGTAGIADPYVAATYKSIESGYRLEFVVYADPVSGFGSWALTTAVVSDAASPPGWLVSAEFGNTEWYASFPDSYVEPGGVLSGCAGSVQEEPGVIGYFIAQTRPGGPYHGSVTPVLIPEPSSLLALLAGVVGLAAGLRRAKR